jgi:hypothetical protein
MAEYKGIKGFKVQYLSADPSDPIIGQTWYNSTSKDLKYTSATAAGAWATGNPLNTARMALAGAGTQTLALAFGGDLPGATDATEEYDGTSWANNPTGLNTARKFLAGCGTQTAALAFGGSTGSPTGATEEYDGSTWTSNPTGLATTRFGLAGCGTQTAALAFGGLIPPDSNATEEYNGSTWTTNPNSMGTRQDSYLGQVAGLRKLQV